VESGVASSPQTKQPSQTTARKHANRKFHRVHPQVFHSDACRARGAEDQHPRTPSVAGI
jgi:hypothetical protein